MYTQINKSKDNKSRAVANSVAQKKRNVKKNFGFADNRPEAIVQRKLHDMANNSPLSKQATQLKAITNDKSNPIQRAKVGERKLGMKEVPEDYAPTQTAYDSLLAKSDKGIFHQHIFFDDNRTPGDIGFHDNELFHEPGMEGAYHWSIQSLNDQEMRLAVHNVGAPGTYHLVGNNCQAYVTKVLKQYNNVKGFYNQGPSKKEHQEKSEMGYSLL